MKMPTGTVISHFLAVPGVSWFLTSGFAEAVTETSLKENTLFQRQGGYYCFRILILLLPTKALS
jgi:hypothetical protein